jgi:peptidyl-prolyl cis-trans isomerase SurA
MKLNISIILLALTLSACASIENPFGSTAPSDLPGNVAGDTADTSSVVGAPETGRIGKRGGTQAAVLVDGRPITRSQIQRRAAFLRLRRQGGGASKAREELINEAVQLAEARRLNTLPKESEVTAAYARFAAGNKMNTKQLNGVMNKAGVTPRGFKDFIRAQIAWQRTLAARGRGGGSATDRNRGPSWLPAIGQSSSAEEQYTLQQVVFVVPKENRRIVNARKSEANRFRQAYRGCENAKAQAETLRNVSVLSRGRMLASELPPNWRRVVADTQPGSLTPPQVTEKGVEMLAVCGKQEVRTANSELFGEERRESASVQEKALLAELRKAATIEIR